MIIMKCDKCRKEIKSEHTQPRPTYKDSYHTLFFEFISNKLESLKDIRLSHIHLCKQCGAEVYEVLSPLANIKPLDNDGDKE